MKIRLYLSVITLALCAAAPASAQKLTSMNTLGKITATFDNSAREWITFAGDVDGEAVSSAHWERFSFSMPDFSKMMESMAEHLAPEQRAQLEMLKNMDVANNPMAAILGQQITGQSAGNTENIQLTISGHDPSNPTITMANTLTLAVDIDSIDSAVGRTIPADLTYVAEAPRAMPQIVYISDDDDEASVTFDTLDIQPGGGHATGRFQGVMCRMDMRKIMDGPDLSDCITVDGTFDTALTEEKSVSH